MTIKPRNEIKWFAEQMEKKLKENDDKPGWRGEDKYDLFDGLENEVNELWYAFGDIDNIDDIVSECADIANFAMMIADSAAKAVEETRRK